jgi:hypothetical protein
MLIWEVPVTALTTEALTTVFKREEMEGKA